jgi:hypothetical protein
MSGGRPADDQLETLVRKNGRFFGAVDANAYPQVFCSRRRIMGLMTIYHWFKPHQVGRVKSQRAGRLRERSSRLGLEQLENRTLLTAVVMNLTGAVTFNSFTDVGFRENTVANLYASVNNKADTNANHFDAKISWGDGTGNTTKADLVYVGTSGNKAHYLVKGSYTYATQGSNFQITVTVTGPGETTITGNGCKTSVDPMPNGLPGTQPNWGSRSFKPPANVQLEMTQAPAITTFAGVGFQRNAVANLYVTLDGKPDTKLADVHAQINWGDSSGWTNAELVYVGINANKAQYLVKGSHVYAEANSSIPVVVYAAGIDGTSLSKQVHDIAISPMTSGIAVLPPTTTLPSNAPANVQLTMTQAPAISVRSGVAFQNVPVANLYVALNGKPDMKLADVHAWVNWGDAVAWTMADLVYVGVSGNFAQYTVKGSHTYTTGNSRMPIVVYATGIDATSFSSQLGFATIV